MIKIRLGLREMSDEDLLKSSQTVITSMGENAAIFDAPTPAIGTFNGKRTSFDNKIKEINAAEAALRALRSELVGEREDLEFDFRKIAKYVETKAAGDPAIIQKAGFTLADTPTPIGALPAVDRLTTRTSDIEGEVLLRWGGVKGAASYVVECATSPNGPWTQVAVTTRNTCKATGLQSGTKYWFHVRAVGSAGPGPWSDPAVKMAV